VVGQNKQKAECPGHCGWFGGAGDLKERTLHSFVAGEVVRIK
jgi:hypothetical protein